MLAEWVVGVGLDVTDRVEAVFDEGLGLRPLVFFVLKGFATGARLMAPSAVAADFGVGYFLVVGDVSVTGEAEPAVMVRKSRSWVRRRNNIYCTPRGLALFGWVEVSEMTGAGSFGWGPG